MGNFRVGIVKSLIQERFGGVQAHFAAAIGKSPAVVNQWLTGVRNIGDASARNIEITLHLPQGYMSQPQRKQQTDIWGIRQLTTEEPVAAYGSEEDHRHYLDSQETAEKFIFSGLQALSALPTIPAEVFEAVLRDAKARAVQILRNRTMQQEKQLPPGFGTPNDGPNPVADVDLDTPLNLEPLLSVDKAAASKKISGED